MAKVVVKVDEMLLDTEHLDALIEVLGYAEPVDYRYSEGVYRFEKRVGDRVRLIPISPAMYAQMQLERNEAES